jgi:isoleucyl-tRNA synthetase
VLDTTLSPELVIEGRARAVVRLIQDARKQAGLNVSDRIEVRYSATDGVSEAFEQHAAYISRETLALALEAGVEADGTWHRAEDEIDGLPVVVALRRAPVPSPSGAPRPLAPPAPSPRQVEGRGLG